MLQKYITRRGSIVIMRSALAINCTTDRDSEQPRVVATGFNSKELWIGHCRACSVTESAPAMTAACTVCVALRCKFQCDVCMLTMCISINSCCCMLVQVYFCLQWLVAAHSYVILVSAVWMLLIDDGRTRRSIRSSSGSTLVLDPTWQQLMSSTVLNNSIYAWPGANVQSCNQIQPLDSNIKRRFFGSVESMPRMQLAGVVCGLLHRRIVRSS